MSLQGIARLQRHEQIVDEVKLALKPFFKHGEINKDDYKLIMRKSVEKVCGILFFLQTRLGIILEGFFIFLSLDCFWLRQDMQVLISDGGKPKR